MTPDFSAAEALACIHKCIAPQHLKAIEVVVFQGCWRGLSYRNIALETGYGEGYVKDIGAQLWRQLSKSLNVKISKQNLFAVVQELFRQQARSEVVAPSLHQHWNDVLDISLFIGREAEQHTILQWLTQEDCRVVSLLGQGGIGKTALAAQCAHLLTSEYETLIWRSFRNAPSWSSFLEDLTLSLSEQQTVEISATAEG